MTDDEIVDGYVKHVDRSANERPPVSGIKAATDAEDYFWAWEAVDGLIHDHPERAWRVILAALERCAPMHEYIIGAGPLEDLLVKYPRQFAARVVTELAHSERFRKAFAVVRFSTEFTTVEDANYFTQTVASGTAQRFAPSWRIAEAADEE